MHAHDTRRGTAASKRLASAKTPAGPDSASLLNLQRLAGNVAVSRMIDRAGQSRSAQRIDYPNDPNEMLQKTYWYGEKFGGAAGVLKHKKKREAGRGKKKAKGNEGNPLDRVVSGVAKGLLDQLDREQGDSGRLEIFRGMSKGEADAVMQWAKNENGVSMRERTEEIIRAGELRAGTAFHDREISGEAQIIPLGSHLGDKEQASKYGKGEGRAMLKFTLKPGAHKYLFDPRYMALPPAGEAPAAIDLAYGGVGAHPIASDGEGLKKGYIGLKPEQEGFFSIALGNAKENKRTGEWRGNASHLLFQMFVESVDRL